MKVIRSFILKNHNGWNELITNETIIDVMSVINLNEEILVSILVETKNKKKPQKLKFYIAQSDKELPNNIPDCGIIRSFLGTVKLHDKFVYHVFMNTEVY